MTGSYLKDKNLSGNALKRSRTKRKILNLLYNNESLSAPFICKRIGVSLPTSITLLNELKNSKFIEIRGIGESQGGRKPTMFGLRNDSIFVFACELGRYKAKLTLFNSHNEYVVPVVTFETNIDDEKLVDKVYQQTQKLIEENNIEKDRIFGLGITMPGLIDENKGINYTIKNPVFRNVKERLEEKCQTLVYINNDARIQAYGEYKFGNAKGYKNAVIVNWNWGIGMGMILNGKLYNGSTGFAGEFSHIKVVKDGDLCICGKRGCLETVASVNAIIKLAKLGIEQGTVTQLSKKFNNRINEIEAEDIIEAAKLGDEFSISLLNEIGLALGKGLSTTIQLLNPDIIVLGGIISGANQFVLIPIQQSLNKYCLEQISANTKIVISENWKQSGLLGITAMLFQKLFTEIYN